MAIRIFLGLSTLVWLPYGLYCLLSPGSLAGAAGVAFQSATGSTELRAMYDGLQAALGALTGLAVVRPALVHTALVATAFLTTGLAAARLLGIALDGGLSAYTAEALGFEIPSAALAWTLLRKALN